MAACAFTDLLLYLRQVILQDSVELRPLFPQKQARSELHAPEDAPWEIQLRRAYPDVVEAVNRQTDTLQQGLHNIEASFNRQIESLHPLTTNTIAQGILVSKPVHVVRSGSPPAGSLQPVPLQPAPLQPAVNPSTVPSAIYSPPAGQPQQVVITSQLPPPSAVPVAVISDEP